MANPKEIKNRQGRLAKAVDNRNKVNEAKDRVAEQQKIMATIEAYGFDKVRIKSVTLDDGTKAYSDGNKMLISDKDGVFVAESSKESGLWVSRLKFNDDNSVLGSSVVRLEREPIRLRDKLDKFSETDIVIGNLSEDVVDKLNQARFNAMSRASTLEKAEKSPEVKMAKELAVKDFGFDEKSLQLFALDRGEIAIVSSNGVAIGKGTNFYFTSKDGQMKGNNQVVLTEVCIDSKDSNPPINTALLTVEDDVATVKKVYDKMQDVYMNSSGYDMKFASKLNSVQVKATNGKDEAFSTMKSR